MSAKTSNAASLTQLDIELNRDVFLRSLLRELTGTLEEVVGLDEASGFIGVVGQHIGDWINAEYCKALGTARLSAPQVAEVLVNLKKRIEGDFYVLSMDEEKIVLGNRACPFGDKVVGRPSLCMMTANVFGTITAENLGYAKVQLLETIAQGHRGCKVVVYLKNNPNAQTAEGTEYFQSEHAE